MSETSKNYIHGPNIEERWWRMTFAEQMGNIGSETNRTCLNQGKNQKSFNNAIARALELFDLTLADPRWPKLQEVMSAKETFCEAISNKENLKDSLQDLQSCLDRYGLEAMERLNNRFV